MKYRFTENTKEVNGIILKQIMRCSDDVLGGWLEKEENLSQEGDAWVSGNVQVFENAQVHGDAHVSGNARVYGNARVFENAWVYGNARVSQNAQVHGDAHVSENAWVFGDARVYENAWVFGNAHVYGNARMYESVHVYGNALVWENLLFKIDLQGYTQVPVAINSKFNISLEEQVIVKRMRYDQKHIEPVYKRFKGINYSLSGLVHIKGNTILQLHQQNIKNQVYAVKKPITIDRYIGIEIEFICPYYVDKIIDAIIKANLQNYVELHNDGSINANEEDEYGHEICILAKEKEYKEVLLRVCSLLESLDALVNDTCGLHVHLDMRNRNKEKCFNNLVAAQNILYEMLPMSRRRNAYCKPVIGRKWRPMRCRYKSINTASYRKHRTIEIRMHSGTTNFNKISNWVDILLKIVNASLIKERLVSVNALALRVRLASHLREYILARTMLFKTAHKTENHSNNIAA